MKLLKLSSNNPKFKTIEFKPGLNILAGLQLTDEEKQTYNGVGKSFSLNLIHFLFNSKKPKEKRVLDFLSNYGVFTLEFSHGNRNYTIRKNFSETHCFINNEKILTTHYPEALRKIFFDASFDENISFKQIFNTFARRYGGAYYNNILTQQGQPETDYLQRYVNLFLLGIDMKLVSEKKQIKDRIAQLDKVKTVIKEYENLLGESNVKDLKDELETLIRDKNNFIIAENYDKFKQEADEITLELNCLRNKIHEISNSIARKLQSLEQSKSVKIDLDKVKKIYEEAKFFFDDKVSVRLDDANEFHLKLMKSRVGRLESEIATLRSQMHELSLILDKKEKYRDSILKDLNSKGALEEYDSISERIHTIEKNITELEKYKILLEGFKREKSELNLNNATLNVNATKYLLNSKDYLDLNENKFRSLVKRFYENHGGCFEIKQAEDAKYLFNIDAQIPRDGSQGINEVKIFCYDFLLYELNPELLGFIAHDGCIFSEMDPRQKSMILKVALEYINNNDLQYFINIGQASLEEILDRENKINILTIQEKKYIENSIILKLYDKDPSQWLFGVSFG